MAVRTSDGRRIVFGRDDVAGTVGEAGRAAADRALEGPDAERPLSLLSNAAT